MSDRTDPAFGANQTRPNRLKMLLGGRSSSSARKSRDSGAIAVWLLIAVYIAFFGTLTVQRHNAFQTTAYDLGHYDQAIWNTRHGRLFAMTNAEGFTNRLGIHVEPILLPLSLLYFVWSDPRALLLLQTIVIALGAWSVYLLTQRALRLDLRSSGEAASSRSQEARNMGRAIPNIQYPIPNTQHASRITHHVLPFTFAAVYLLFPTLESANMFDFHALALAPTFFLFALYCLETERWGGFALFAVLTMSCKEDMPLLVAMLGFYALLVLKGRKRLIGLATMVMGGVWFLLAVGWIMPHFDPGSISPFENRYGYLGDSPAEKAITLVTRPGVVLNQLRASGSLGYVRDLLVPVAFLSLLAPQVLMLAIPPLAVNLLSTDGFMHQLEGFHYGVTLVPVVVASAAYGAGWLVRRFPRFRALPLLLAAVVLAATLLYHYGHGYTPLASDFRGSWPTVTDQHHVGEEIAHRIPTEASLTAPPFPNPHASERQQLYAINRVENGLPAPLHDADYVWFDVTDNWPLHPNDLKTGAENLLAGDYGVDQATDGWLLLRRGAPDKALPDGFYDFARTADPQSQYPMRLQFLLDGEPALECLGFDLTYDPRTATYDLTFYWRALRPLPPGLWLYPFYFDDATGQVLEDTTLRPMIAAVWYPPERWQPGEIVKTSTLPWDVGPTFSVGLGVTQGDDWEEVDQRLPIHVESSDLVVRLFDDDTWMRLLHVEDGEPVKERRVFALPSLQYPLDVDFGGQIRLLGYDLKHETRNRPSGEYATRITLYWQAQLRSETSYTIFAQLLGPSGEVRAQKDSGPHSGGYPTIWWLPGEVVADPLTLELPPDAPRQGTYRLIVGLYDPATGVRLLVTGTGADFVELGTVQR